MSREQSLSKIIPAGFFAFRTPLLPIEELEAWNADLAAPSAMHETANLVEVLAQDRDLLRRRLRALIERPEIREALFVASPSLVDGLGVWFAKPDSKKGRRAEEALVRYIQRMMIRATPFGLFSGCSLGRVGSESRLELAARGDYQRHTRLDMDYLFALAEDLVQSPELRRVLEFRPNTSLYLAAGRWRYAEARLVGSLRSHHLVAVETTEYLEATLKVARAGATVERLAQTLVDTDPDGEVTLEEAEEFVFELIDSQMLMADLSPLVTGPEPIHELIEQLEDLPTTEDLPTIEDVRLRLEHVRTTLAHIDQQGLGRDPEMYHQIARRLEELPTQVTLPRLFQVDMVKPAARASLGDEIIDEIKRSIDLLWRLSGTLGENALSQFCQDFQARYEDGQAVPLAEVLDEEVGIGFDRSRGADASPLLEGLAFPPRTSERSITWGKWPQRLLERMTQVIRDQARVFEIRDQDLEGFDHEGLPPLPDGFQAMATVAAPSAESIEGGDFRVQLRSASGPSGAQLLGRFCHADPELRKHVEQMLREEEKLRPDAIFAEVVHLPEGRIGNILSRPVMRGYEIPFLGRGKAEHQIPASDLMVTVSGQNIHLFSKSLGRQVLPRLTSAHNFSNRSLGVYRFLCSLQSHQLRGGVSWNWSIFENLDFLPRVQYGRAVLARARWNVKREELQQLTKGDGTQRFQQLCDWRKKRDLPRRVMLMDSDNELLVDFDNILSAETFVALVKGRPSCVLVELFPDLDDLWVRGPEGRFICELVVPFLRQDEGSSEPARTPVPQGEAVPQRETVPQRKAPANRVRRTFATGSEWLYAKLFTGTATADQLLTELVAPLTHEVMSAGAADHWFFIRYGDPLWHLRLRFHGEPDQLLQEVLPRLTARAAPFLEDGRLWRFQLDTYEREVERYGGPDGIELAERLAHVDSESTVAIMQLLEGDEGADARWRLAIRGIDQLLADMGLVGDEKMAVISRAANNFAKEFQVDSRFKKQMSDRLRRERRELDLLLDAAANSDHPLGPGLEIFDQRTAHLRPIVAEMRAREQAGRLTLSVADLTLSFLHMFSNRWVRSDGRSHEVVLYDFVHRLALSRHARANARKKKQDKK